MMSVVKKYHILLVIACVAVFLPVLWNDFQMGWDDQWQVMNRYTEGGFTRENLQAVFTDYYYGQYSPVNAVAYMAIYKMFGYHPAVFHLYSLLLHIANCCLLFAFLSRLVFAFGAQTASRKGIAFLAALLFAVHPLQVESIAWISASKIPLYTFFTLLALQAYLQYARSQNARYYFVAFVCFVCAFGSKEQSVVLPVTLLALDWALTRYRNSDGTGNWQQLLLEKIPFFLFAVFAALQTRSHQSMEFTAQVAGYPLGQRFVFACYSLVVYAGRFVVPAKLLYIYPFPITPGDDLPAQYLIYPVVVAAGLYLLCIRFKKLPRPIVFGLLFYFINMVLMLHLLTMPRFMITADRYVYLASAGLFFVAAWYAVPWLQKIKAEGKKWSLVAASCYLLYLGGYAHARTYVWKDSDTVKKGFWELVHDDSPTQETPEPEEQIPEHPTEPLNED